MSYLNYGVDQALVDRVKAKMKNPLVKDRVKAEINGLTKFHLQDSATVGRLVSRLSAILGEHLNERQRSGIIRFVLDQKIDPNNTFHLIRLWGMFR
ncbi:stage VI sporulation protein F [Gorillibacterium timonense]|uniref:stage VI sporulation protein F n=1 Tax=Gorillibacterium timonense TaxID=1689269 RepID=UPI00071D9BCE|nr:stage VI sporulation protein F [Gorillibacterium timonense]